MTPLSENSRAGSIIANFLQQEHKSYRNMQIVFYLLALQFVFPALSYLFTPDVALSQFAQFGQLLGAPGYTVSEESIIWRVLASSNVFCLAFLCTIMALNIRRFQVCIYVFVVLKGYSALAFLYVFLIENAFPVFLFVFFWDGLAVVLIWHFGHKSYRLIGSKKGPIDATLVPRLRFESSD